MLFFKNRLAFISTIILILIINQPIVEARDFEIVGTYEVPYRFIEKGTSNIQGIDIDIIRVVMEELNIAYNIELINSGSRIIKQATTGKVDMVLSFSKKSDRTYLLYPQNSYKNLSWNFFINKKDISKIIYNELSDLKGLRVGATQDWSYTPEFWQAGLNLNVLTNNNLQLLKLYRGRIDIVPLNTTSALYKIKKKGYSDKITFLPKPLKSKPYFNAFVVASSYPNKETLLQRYDKIIYRMINDGTIQEIFDKYLN
ncbi:substrate-binding periplasmic protein [Psychromonas hadalis]|uniref:substrate-binding periplasmic protein n=1 Tax=Psychromonas hadalis TaxID=211669 RepID=UPI0003B3D43B|nr:ABC transporter substrate-binding protein [Psychromonas hadalis]